jgi:hypothetical protein
MTIAKARIKFQRHVDTIRFFRKGCDIEVDMLHLMVLFALEVSLT